MISPHEGERSFQLLEEHPAGRWNQMLGQPPSEALVCEVIW